MEDPDEDKWIVDDCWSQGKEPRPQRKIKRKAFLNEFSVGKTGAANSTQASRPRLCSSRCDQKRELEAGAVHSLQALARSLGSEISIPEPNQASQCCLVLSHAGIREGTVASCQPTD